MVEFGLALPAVVALLAFGAHLYRELGALVGLMVVPVVFLLLFLLLLPRGWVARLVQVVLVIATLEWTRFAVLLARERVEDGRPWIRATAILGGMAVLSLLAAALFETRALLRVYPRRNDW